MQRREADDIALEAERPSKRARHEIDLGTDEDLFPQSRFLWTQTARVNPNTITEADVGITEYVTNTSPIHAIIKQRFTDFMVFEVDKGDTIVHLKSLDKPNVPDSDETSESDAQGVKSAAKPYTSPAASAGHWLESFDSALAPFLSPPHILQLKELYLQGPLPPFVSDSGWAGRTANVDEHLNAVAAEVIPPDDRNLGKHKPRNKGRAGRSARESRNAADMERNSKREDTRRVISDPIESKADRASLHQLIRDLFGGKLDSQTHVEPASTSVGSKVVIRWGNGKPKQGMHSLTHSTSPSSRRPIVSIKELHPDYIHFTMQKTNRDSQDAISHLARLMRFTPADFGVAGTKDKRGVTTQRVSVRRKGKTLHDAWRMMNNMHGRRTLAQTLGERAERGIRVGDFEYQNTPLELGMLNGNAFVITLRNLQPDSPEFIAKAMDTIEKMGFINYYGMQRFGTASIPTHAIGLALLQSDWRKAVSLILRPRPGEHPDVDMARRAWSEDGDINRALQLMPRRVVAERCILEHFQIAGGSTDCAGALATIPRNLRTMYVHAYQSCIWNAVVSERIRRFGSNEPVVGDLVFDKPSQQTAKQDVHPTPTQKSRRRKPFEPPAVKILTAEDLEFYTIFDVIMPLPGQDIVYPDGELGTMYSRLLEADGLDPRNLTRKQKEYSLLGSYRHILHRPKAVSWEMLRYTDPDIPLAQADEDKLLGFDVPLSDTEGRFTALQIKLTLGTAAYATMMLRELTKTETSSGYQAELTRQSEDQAFRREVDDDQLVDPPEGNSSCGI